MGKKMKCPVCKSEMRIKKYDKMIDPKDGNTKIYTFYTCDDCGKEEYEETKKIKE
jgi:YgiT-type zinc finger domain-containing protein